MFKVLLFGHFAEKAGKREIIIQENNLTVEKVVETVEKQYIKAKLIIPYLVCVNEQTVDMSYVITEGDEVALMPPFSGG